MKIMASSIPALSYPNGNFLGIQLFPQKCPEESGEAVTWARAILANYTDSTYFNECEMMWNPEYNEEDTIVPGHNNCNPDISIFPNPADAQVTVELADPAEADLDIKVHDLMGVLKLSDGISESDWETTLNTSTLPNGIYIISIWEGETRLKAAQLLILH